MEEAASADSTMVVSAGVGQLLSRPILFSHEQHEDENTPKKRSTDMQRTNRRRVWTQQPSTSAQGECVSNHRTTQHRKSGPCSSTGRSIWRKWNYCGFDSAAGTLFYTVLCSLAGPPLHTHPSYFYFFLHSNHLLLLTCHVYTSNCFCETAYRCIHISVTAIVFPF